MAQGRSEPQGIWGRGGALGAGVLARPVLCTNARSNVCSFLGAPGKGAIVLWVRKRPTRGRDPGPWNQAISCGFSGALIAGLWLETGELRFQIAHSRGCGTVRNQGCQDLGGAGRGGAGLSRDTCLPCICTAVHCWLGCQSALCHPTVLRS